MKQFKPSDMGCKSPQTGDVVVDSDNTKHEYILDSEDSCTGCSAKGRLLVCAFNFCGNGNFNGKGKFKQVE